MPKGQGSWVAMTVDGEGRLICSDQYGKLYRVTPAPTGKADAATEVEELAIPLSGSHGLLWKDGVLFVSINETQGQGGVWRVEERDGKYAEPVRLKELRGIWMGLWHAMVSADADQPCHSGRGVRLAERNRQMACVLRGQPTGSA